MKAKNLYLPEDVIKYVEKESKSVDRGFSNYIVMLVRAEMAKSKQARVK